MKPSRAEHARGSHDVRILLQAPAYQQSVPAEIARGGGQAAQVEKYTGNGDGVCWAQLCYEARVLVTCLSHFGLLAGRLRILLLLVV